MTKILNTVFHCPKCKKELFNTSSCSECSKIYYNNEGFFDFTNTPTGNINSKFSNLLSNIHSHGYSKALKISKSIDTDLTIKKEALPFELLTKIIFDV